MDYIDKLVVNSIVGDLRQGGTLVTATVEGDTDLVAEGDNIMLDGQAFATFDDLGGREIFNGHVLETPSFDFGTFTSRAQVRIGTANYRLRAGNIQDVGYTEQASPANDHQIAPTMRISSCYNHSMQRHCNFVHDATTMPDGIIFTRTIETSDTALARMNVRKGNFWNVMVNTLGGGEEGGVQFFRPYYNRRNEEYYQPAPHFMTTPPTSKGTLTKDHIRGRPRVTVRNSKPEEITGQVQIIAVASANTIYEAKYPSLQPTSGKIVTYDSGIWADSQARADTLAQNAYEWLTRPYTLQIEVDPALILLGDDGKGLDLADKITINYDGPTEDTATGHGMHINFSNDDFFVYGFRVTYDPLNKTGRGQLILEADN